MKYEIDENGNITPNPRYICSICKESRILKPCHECSSKKRAIFGPGCGQEAAKKSRYSHKSWIVYKTADWSDGTDWEWVAEPLTRDSLKRCLIASGTQGKWTLIDNGVSSIGFWWLGCNLLKQIKRGAA